MDRQEARLGGLFALCGRRPGRPQAMRSRRIGEWATLGATADGAARCRATTGSRYGARKASRCSSCGGAHGPRRGIGGRQRRGDRRVPDGQMAVRVRTADTAASRAASSGKPCAGSGGAGRTSSSEATGDRCRAGLPRQAWERCAGQPVPPLSGRAPRRAQRPRRVRMRPIALSSLPFPRAPVWRREGVPGCRPAATDVSRPRDHGGHLEDHACCGPAAHPAAGRRLFGIRRCDICRHRAGVDGVARRRTSRSGRPADRVWRRALQAGHPRRGRACDARRRRGSRCAAEARGNGSVRAGRYGMCRCRQW